MFIDTGNLSDIPYIDFVKENCANSFDKLFFKKQDIIFLLKKVRILIKIFLTGY